ncbi:MAG: hypothetical protein ACRCX7_11170 [Cetobacterium sp.]|uniref:hypothetical protein n=1 Tax=Cetobacterium sp. TaxID=2071632 RepID=UPI003F375668
MINVILTFLWSSIVSYVAKRCTGDFMDSLFDTALTAFAKATPSKVDDELVEKWKEKKKEA